jgi:hypothetical protein
MTFKELRAGLLVAFVTAGPAFAKMGDLVASFPARGANQHYGLAASTDYLYTHYASSVSSWPIFIIDRRTGSFVGSYRSPFYGVTPGNYNCFRGLSYEAGGYIWATNYAYDIVIKFRASDGSFISSWGTGFGTKRTYGICARNDKERPGTLRGFNISEYYAPHRIWNFSTSGSLVSSFQGCAAADLAWDYWDGLVWAADVTDGYVYGYVYEMHHLLSSWSWRVRPTINNAFGIAYYRNYLYVLTTSGTPDEYIWVFHCILADGVPASLGRVKALYR